MFKHYFTLSAAVLALSLALLIPRSVDADDGMVAAAGFSTTLPASGVALTTWDGGSVDTISSDYPNVKSIWVSVGGSLVGYVAGAPNFANAGFLSQFSDGEVAAGSVMIVVVAEQAAVAPTPTPTATPPSVEVGPVPASLGLDPFYQKYVDANGIPIVSSALVPDAALLEARAIVVGMLDGIPDVRDAIAANGVRVAVMAESEVTTDIPEHSDLYVAFPGTDWDSRARGLGATLARPATSGAEENLLCYASDPYAGESILVHEFAHTFFDYGVAYLPNGTEYVLRLAQAYASSIAVGRWHNTYAATNIHEYWAEAVQSWFNTNVEAIPADGIHNNINTRAELRAYDPQIADLIDELILTSWEPSCPTG